jgi:predicted dehydrogenase
MKTQSSRRQVLKQLGVTAAALTMPRQSFPRSGYSANDTLNIGCIGTGGRCRALMKVLAGMPGIRLGAVCDVWEDSREQGKKLADPQAFVTVDYHEVLERRDIDAVVIGAPDHWHVPMLVDACAAGKDVYVEKPLTHDLSEGAAAIEAQNHHQRVVQVGMQQRSMPQFQKAYEIVRAGGIGSIHKVHLTWNRNTADARRVSYGIDPATVDWKRFLGNAKNQPFDEYRFRQWRWFWDFGGGILTDLMVHFIDVAHWFLDLDHPDAAATIGDQFTPDCGWETPDTIQTLLHYGNRQAQAYFEGTFINARNAAMIEFMGTDATLYLDRGRYEVHPERGRDKITYSELVLGAGQRGADFYRNPDGELVHLSNWIECVRSRRQPNAPAEAGVSAATAAHLGNMAYRSGRVAHWQGQESAVVSR